MYVLYAQDQPSIINKYTDQVITDVLHPVNHTLQHPQGRQVDTDL